MRVKVPATLLKEAGPCNTVKRGESTTQKKPISNISENVAKQRKRGVIHTLTRMTQDGGRRQPAEQKVPSFNEFPAIFSESLVVSRRYYYKLYDKQPSKSALHANLCELPVYSLLIELHSGNEEKFGNILPWID